MCVCVRTTTLQCTLDSITSDIKVYNTHNILYICVSYCLMLYLMVMLGYYLLFTFSPNIKFTNFPFAKAISCDSYID